MSHDTEADAALTIDELARETGMTTRNIRAHQSRGLLPPPQVRGRTGYYGPEHVTRLELIRELQDDGFNLEAIRRLIERTGGSTADVLGFTRAVRAPFEEEEPQIVGLEEIARRFPDPDPAILQDAIDQGLLRPLGEDRFEEPSPTIGRAGVELARLGVPAKRSLALAKDLRKHADGIAKLYIDLFLEEVWRPFLDADRPQDDWPQVRETLERLRPLAAETLLAMFQLVMTDRVEEAFGRELERAAGKR